MPSSPPWIKLTLAAEGGSLTVTPESSVRGGGDKHKTSISFDDLYDLEKAIGEAATANAAFGDAARKRAQRLYEEVFKGKTLELTSSDLADAARTPPGRLLVRLAIPTADHRRWPFEAMWTPAGGQLGTDGLLAGSAQLHVVRDVSGGDAVRPRRILGRVRILVVAAAQTRVEAGIAGALAGALADRAIDEIDVISGAQTSTPANLRTALEQRSAPGRRPHIVHFIAHGAVRDVGGVETPSLVLPGDAGASVELPAAALAADLQRCFGDDLRLVMLDACEGASPADSGSAAEILARRAAVAVVAHLWPVDTEVAAAISKSFYTSLTGWSQQGGDVAACLSAARAGLLPARAGGVSPVLYLRGADPTLFDFRGRTKPAAPAAPPAAPRPELVSDLLDGRFALLLGDPGEDSLAWRAALRGKLAEKLRVSEDALPSLGQAIDRYALLEGREKLGELFEDVSAALLEKDDAPVTHLAWELARVLKPGVHATLLHLPALEHALANQKRQSHVYVVTFDKRSLWTRWREADKARWETPPDNWQAKFDASRDYVILRPYRGLLPTGKVLDAVLTDDDHARNPRGAEMPRGWDPLVRHLRTPPALVVGVSLLDWRNRMVLSKLFDRALAEGSVAVLPPDADQVEEKIWTKRGGGWDETCAESPVEVARLDTETLAKLLERHPS